MLKIPDNSYSQVTIGNAERVARALNSLPVGRGLTRIAAEAFVSHLIDNLPLDSKARRDILPGTEPSLLNTFELLKKVSYGERVGFFKSVLDRALERGKSRDLPFLGAVLTQAGYWLNPVERRRLLLHVSQQRPSGAAAKCWLSLARSASTVTQAYRSIHACGRDRLLSFASRELKEYIVTIEAIHAFKSIAVPAQPSRNVTHPAALANRADQLRECLREAQALLKSMTWASNSARFTRLKGMLKASASLLDQRLENADTIGSKNRALRSEIARIGLELTVGKLLNCEQSRPWSDAELAVVRSALEETGIFRNICSRVYEIKRVAELEDACALFTSCGTRIELEDRCFIGGKTGLAVRQGCSPEEVVIHELGHSFSGVSNDAIQRRVRKTGGANVNEWFLPDHFPEIFLRLGRWGGMVSDFKVLTSGEVEIHGNRVTLGAPVKFDGELKVLQHSSEYRCLFWYGYPLGEFPRRSDSRIDPGEQLSEGFSDYYRAPEQLIEDAPNLFWYFESIYHRYDGDKNISSRLRDRLKSKAIHVPQEVPAEVDAFSLLSRAEQMQILADAKLVPRRWKGTIPTPQQREHVFLKACAQGLKQRAIGRSLRETLAEYNPALLLARAYLFSGRDVSVVSIRGSSSLEIDTQESLRKEIEGLLGPRFSRKEIYLLNDARKSARYGKRASYHQKVVSLITERLLGFSTRADGQHKRFQKTYRRVVLFTDMQPTAEYVRRFARSHKLGDSIEVRSPRDIDSSAAARKYLETPWGQGDDEQSALHIFTLEDIVNLPASFYVRLQDGGRILREIPLKQFLLKPDKAYWIGVTARQNPAYRARDLVFDDTEFTCEDALQRLLREGREDRMMLRCRAQTAEE